MLKQKATKNIARIWICIETAAYLKEYTLIWSDKVELLNTDKIGKENRPVKSLCTLNFIQR